MNYDTQFMDDNIFFINNKFYKIKSWILYWFYFIIHKSLKKKVEYKINTLSYKNVKINIKCELISWWVFVLK